MLFVESSDHENLAESGTNRSAFDTRQEFVDVRSRKTTRRSGFVPEWSGDASGDEAGKNWQEPGFGVILAERSTVEAPHIQQLD